MLLTFYRFGSNVGCVSQPIQPYPSERTKSLSQSPDHRDRRACGLRIHPEVRKGLRILATIRGMTMEDYLDDLLRREIDREQIRVRIERNYAQAT